MTTFIDLSRPLEHRQPAFPMDPEIEVTECGNLDSHGYNLTQLSTSTHQATHLDAPFHFYDDGLTVDEIPLDKFFGPASLVDLAPHSALASKTPITPEMLAPHEEKFHARSRVICRTGWDQQFGSPEFFTDFPFFTVEAARWIAAQSIALLGIDTPSPGAEQWKEVHQTLLKPGVDIVILEGLVNLVSLPDQFTLAAFPLAIKGRDGSPVRAIAILYPDQ